MIYRYFLSLTLVFALFTLSIPQATFAQVTATQTTSKYAKELAAIEEKLEKRRQELGVPGVGFAIVKDGEVIVAKGFGYKDFEKKIPATADTQFAIGSSTKAFTALSVLMSADQGKLSLDDSPKKYLSYFKMKDADADKNMTVRDLMDHSSGLNRTDLAMITNQLNRQELIRVAGEAEPMAKLNEKFFYNNIMFAAAGEVTASVQKMSWEKFIPEKIFKPLGMKNSTMTIQEVQKAKDYSFGYDYNFDNKQTIRKPFMDISATAPAGSISSSPRDMTNWLKFVIDGGAFNGKRLLSEKSYDEWTKVQNKITPNGKFGYGLGWFVRDWNGVKVVEHGGNVDGFTSTVATIPEKKLGFVLFTNNSYSSLGEEMMPFIWETFLGKPEAPKPTNTNETKPANNDSAKELIGKYAIGDQFTVIIKEEKDGKVTANIEGQPPYTLIAKAKDEFTPQGLPEGFYLKTKRNAEGKITDIILGQPEGETELKKVEDKKADDKPKITADELMAKAIEAVGGEANWRKINSRVVNSTIDAVHQGVKGTAVSYQLAPNKSATETTMTAVGKTIAKGLEIFDGTNGEETFTFSQTEKYTGKKLEDTKLSADFYGLLNWKTNYKTVVVKGIEKVGDEDCYVVEITPEKGTKFTDLYSTKSFLLLKRNGSIPVSVSDITIPYSIIYSDYREVDGVKMPFKTLNSTPTIGDMISVITSVKHNVTIDNNVFMPRKVSLK
ncbi:MAG: beta-lactamase family protein [Pyrinomonadaceae bacterium]|jgi:CubicO group peptidase (beta-lactamase class C family)|nr:beta-lactamase family protein [Pyrinomonadaceae bacterium]